MTADEATRSGSPSDDELPAGFSAAREREDEAGRDAKV